MTHLLARRDPRKGAPSVPEPGDDLEPAPVRRRVSTPIRILQVFAVTLFVLPSFTVLKPLGAAAFPAGIVGMVAMGVWAVWTALGSHNPLLARTPIRVAFGALWVTSLLSYVSMQFRNRTTVEILGADRWLLFLAAITGIAFIAAECLRTLEDMKRVLRALMWGGSFCSVVAMLQYFFLLDLTPFFGNLLPGFTFDAGLAGVQFRAGLNRVPGTTVHPIELGTTAAMLLPLAIYMAMYDRSTSLRRRVAPAVLIGACIPMSVSRSATLGVAVSMAIFVAVLPPRQRLVAFGTIPVVLCGVFLTLRGIISTLTGYFQMGGKDPSISTRTDDYPLVEHFVRQHPWFGRGGGTYLNVNALTILDNQYLKWVIEFGIVGLAVLVIFFFALPAATAFMGQKRARTPELKLLNGALAAGVVSAALASGTFDSLSFPVFTCAYALILGLIGACWRFSDVRPSWAKGGVA